MKLHFRENFVATQIPPPFYKGGVPTIVPNVPDDGLGYKKVIHILQLKYLIRFGQAQM